MKSSLRGISTALVAVCWLFSLLAGGCSSKVVVPPVTGDAAMLHLTGKFVWFDLHTPDVIASQRFYSAVFDWMFERTDDDSGKVKTILFDDMRIGNAMEYEMTEMGPAHWVAYISVPDTEAAHAMAMERGAKVVHAPFEMPDRGMVTELEDPTGAVFGMLTSPVGDPPDRKLMDGYWISPELRTIDMTKSINFYAPLAGYTVHDVTTGKDKVYQLKSSDTERAYVTQLESKCHNSLWVPFVSVRDIDQILSRVKEAGGRILLAPDTAVRSGQFAIIQEPAGSVVGVREYENPF